VKRQADDKSPITDLENEEHRTFVYPETVFIAVTAYQNQLVIIMFSLESKACIFERIIYVMVKHVVPEQDQRLSILV
jgi:hypothetical protein